MPATSPGATAAATERSTPSIAPTSSVATAGRPAARRLEHGHAARVVAAREQHDVGGLELARHPGRRDRAAVFGVRRQVVEQLRVVRPDARTADDPQPRGNASLRQHAGQRDDVLEPLAHRDARRHEDQRRIARRPGVGLEPIEPDRVRDDDGALAREAVVAHDVVAEHAADADQQARALDPHTLHQRAHAMIAATMKNT